MARTGRTQRWRPVDIAETAGISVQQVRNYVDLGVLPPVERTPSGYRIFTGEHAAAVTVVRRMVEGHGWARTRTIMRAVHEAISPPPSPGSMRATPNSIANGPTSPTSYAR